MIGKKLNFRIEKRVEFTKEFERFIRDSVSGKRKKRDGRKISPGTIKQYVCVLKSLEKYQLAENEKLSILIPQNIAKRHQKREKKYWKDFEAKFTKFLYKNEALDNYIGLHFKIIKTFFRYLENIRQYSVSDTYKTFRILTEDIPILVLAPERLQFMINNNEFTQSLPDHLQKSKDIFIVGCTVGLRFSDLIKITTANLVNWEGQTYLQVRAQKNSIITRIKLSPYVLKIFKNRKNGERLLPQISLHRFNNNIRAICRAAGWTEPVERMHFSSLKTAISNSGSNVPFCNLVTSHMMRRTAITTLLTLGMPELLVRRISGHSKNSTSFLRYVEFSQNFMDNEIDKIYSKLDNKL
jgi:integrase